MVVAFATLTVDPDTLVGAAPSSTVIVTVRTNTGGAIIDAAGDKIYLGSSSQKISGATSASFSLPRTDQATSPTAFQYTVDLNYVDAATRERKTWNSGWFSFTAAANLADVAAAQYVPPTWMSDAITTLQGYVDDAAAAADGFGIGTVTTGTAGSSAAASVTGAAPSKVLNLTIPRGDTGATGSQGLPGPGSAAWTASQAVVVGSVRQSPTGEWIRSTAARTTGATYDTTEAGFWTPIHVPTALTANAVGSTTEIRTVTGPRSTKWRESFARGNVTEGATTLENMTWGWGFNMTASYGKEVSTEPMMRIGMESSWLNGGVVRSEMHLGAFIDPASVGTEIRPISMDIRHGGDSGKGSIGIAFTVSETDAAAGMSINSMTGAALFRLSTTGFTLSRTTAIQRGSSAASLLTIGDHLHDAFLALDAKGVGKTNKITFQREGVDSWYLYDAASATELYLRDVTNSHNQMYFLKGATDEAARTDIYSLVRIKGSETQFGPSGQVRVGTLGTTEGWLDSTVALNIRAQGGALITSKSKHQFDSNVGFNGTAPLAKPTISGSRGGNAALASLLTALASYGLITDSSSA